MTQVRLAELSSAAFNSLAASHPGVARPLLFDLGCISAQRLRAPQRGSIVRVE